MIRMDTSRSTLSIAVLLFCLFTGCTETKQPAADERPRSSLMMPAREIKTKLKKLPEYKVLGVVRLLGGHYFAEILIPEFSRRTPIPAREAALREIAKIEDLTIASLYSTKDAFKANNSDRFARRHPDAMKTGYLGALEGGVFVPGEALYR
jgi:hypothetical protein